MNFEQRINLNEYQNRFDYFASLCEGKKVLHVGCVDPGIAHENSLHGFLSTVCRELDGLDVVDSEEVRSVGGRLFLDPKEVIDRYDVMIVPEVIEHVGNVQTFLQGLNSISFAEFVVTAPNALAPPPSLWNASFYHRTGIVEIVHPDHKCWYSPYTLLNTILSFTPWIVDDVFLILRGTMVGVRGHKD